MKNLQFFILHLTRVIGLPVSFPLHPGHWLFFRKYAKHIPQFIPQGAINSFFIVSFFRMGHRKRTKLNTGSPGPMEKQRRKVPSAQIAGRTALPPCEFTVNAHACPGDGSFSIDFIRARSNRLSFG
jgi:hypothetical protein